MEYIDLNIRIGPRIEENRYAVYTRSPVIGEIGGVFAPPVTDEQLELLVLRVGLARRGMRQIRSPEWRAAREFGQKLFGALFADRVFSGFVATHNESIRQGKGVRLILSLDAPELANYPWELMYDREAGQFLSLFEDTPVVRNVEILRPVLPLTVVPPLRILAVASSPQDFTPLDLARERRNLSQAVQSQVEAGMIEIDWLSTATVDNLREALLKRTYHIFHFIGHGGFDEAQQDGVLVLENESGGAKMLSGERLAVLLGNHRTLRLAVLNACEGARTSRQDPFAGTAMTLMRTGNLPAVVAMQFEITDTAAIDFSRGFYAAVAAGRPVDAAVGQGRQTIFSHDNDTEWCTPVLYLRAADGRIFDIDTAGAARLKAEQERLAREQEEQARLAKEKAEAERIAAERERIEKAQRLAAERAEQEQLARERAEQERLAREKAEQEQLAEQAQAERARNERAEKEREEQERRAREKGEKERLAAARAEEERRMREGEESASSARRVREISTPLFPADAEAEPVGGARELPVRQPIARLLEIVRLRPDAIPQGLVPAGLATAVGWALAFALFSPGQSSGSGRPGTDVVVPTAFLGGLMTALALRLIRPELELRRLALIAGAWGIGWALLAWEVADLDRYLFLLSPSWTRFFQEHPTDGIIRVLVFLVGGGLLSALALRWIEPRIRPLQAAYVVVGWALAWTVARGVLGYLYLPLVRSGFVTVSFGLFGLLAGAIGGSIMFMQLSRTSRLPQDARVTPTPSAPSAIAPWGRTQWVSIGITAVGWAMAGAFIGLSSGITDSATLLIFTLPAGVIGGAATAAGLGRVAPNLGGSWKLAITVGWAICVAALAFLSQAAWFSLPVFLLGGGLITGFSLHQWNEALSWRHLGGIALGWAAAWMIVTLAIIPFLSTFRYSISLLLGAYGLVAGGLGSAITLYIMRRVAGL